MVLSFFRTSVLIFLVSALLPNKCFAQQAILSSEKDSLTGFNRNEALARARELNLNAPECIAFIKREEISFIRMKYNLPQPPQPEHFTDLRLPEVLAPGCNNADFENGNFTGWSGAIGYNSLSSLPLQLTGSGINTLGTNSAETSCSFHTLLTAAAGTDRFGGFPVIDPSGGKYSVRLGGENINTCGATTPTPTPCTPGGPLGQSEGEILQSTFGVTASNALFTYNYAVVLDDGGHASGNQPYFKVEVLDNKGKLIPCFQYYQECVAGKIPPGYKKSKVRSSFGGDSLIYYLPWTTNSIDLTSYIGSTVTIKFTAAGCTAGAHFGYAYVDCSCSFFSLGTSSSCTTHSISAPPGAMSYQWTTIPPGQPGLVSPTNQQSVTFNKNGTFQVTITTGTGCSYQVDTTVACPDIPTPILPSLCGDLTLYSAFSPNHDGQNDSWQIDCIETYPDNEVTILNQWGQTVWFASGYDNKTTVWKGTNQKGENLPDGTYFYMVKLSWKKHKGRVELIR